MIKKPAEAPVPFTKYHLFLLMKAILFELKNSIMIPQQSLKNWNQSPYPIPGDDPVYIITCEIYCGSFRADWFDNAYAFVGHLFEQTATCIRYRCSLVDFAVSLLHPSPIRHVGMGKEQRTRRLHLAGACRSYGRASGGKLVRGAQPAPNTVA